MQHERDASIPLPWQQTLRGHKVYPCWMGKIHEFYRRHSVGAPVATILALWGFIERILDWVGLVDQARSMMDPHHWFTQVISWPHFDLIISGIGFLLLLYLGKL